MYMYTGTKAYFPFGVILHIYTLLVFWRSVSEFPAGPAGDAKWVVVLGTVVVTSTDRKIYNYVFCACK